MRYRLSRRAAQAEIEIIDYRYQAAGLGSAIKLRAQLLAAYEFISANPGVGQYRSDIVSRRCKFYFSRPYWIVFETDEGNDMVTILTVIDARRDVGRVLNRALPPNEE